MAEEDRPVPECVVCLTPFDASDQHAPRVLTSCGHSICHTCASLLAVPAGPPAAAQYAGAAPAGGGSAGQLSLVRCPECGARTRLPASGAGGLPKNIELLRWLGSPAGSAAAAPRGQLRARGVLPPGSPGDLWNGLCGITGAGGGAAKAVGHAQAWDGATALPLLPSKAITPAPPQEDGNRHNTSRSPLATNPMRALYSAPAEEDRPEVPCQEVDLWELPRDPGAGPPPSAAAAGPAPNRRGPMGGGEAPGRQARLAAELARRCSRVSRVLGLWGGPGPGGAATWLVTERLQHPLQLQVREASPEKPPQVSEGERAGEVAAAASTGGTSGAAPELAGWGETLPVGGGRGAARRRRVEEALAVVDEACECLEELHARGGAVLGHVCEGAFGRDAFGRVRVSLGSVLSMPQCDGNPLTLRQELAEGSSPASSSSAADAEPCGAGGSGGPGCRGGRWWRHLSPELVQAHGARHSRGDGSHCESTAPAQADVWGVGCLLGQLLLGRSPLDGSQGEAGSKAEPGRRASIDAWLQELGRHCSLATGGETTPGTVQAEEAEGTALGEAWSGAGALGEASDVEALVRECLQEEPERRPPLSAVRARLARIRSSASADVAVPTEGGGGEAGVHPAGTRLRVLAFSGCHLVPEPSDLDCPAGGRLTSPPEAPAEAGRQPGPAAEDAPVHAAASMRSSKEAGRDGAAGRELSPTHGTTDLAQAERSSLAAGRQDSASGGATVPCSREAPLVLEGHRDHASALAVAGGRLFSASFDKSICAWSLADGHLEATLQEHSHRIMALAAARSVPYLASGDYGGRVVVWDTAPEQPVLRASWEDSHDWRYSGVLVLIIVDDSVLYTGCGDRTVKAWSLQDHRVLATMEGHKGPVLALEADQEILYSGSWDGTVRLWWRPDHSPISTLSCSCLAADPALPGPAPGVKALAILPDGRLVCGCMDGSLQVWRGSQCVAVVSGHKEAVGALAAEGQYLYSGGWDHALKVWEMAAAETPLEARCLVRAHSLPVTALLLHKGVLFSASADGSIKAWVAS